MIKRIITGIIVGTALMFVNRSMPKAAPYNVYGTDNFQDVSVSQNTEHLDVNNNKKIIVGGEEVAGIYDTSDALDINNFSISGYTVLNSLPQNYPERYPMISQSDSNPSVFMVGIMWKPVPDGYSQTFNMFRFDTSTMPFQVKNILIACSGVYNTCTAFFSKGDLPTFSNDNPNTDLYSDFTVKLNSDTMIFTYNPAANSNHRNTEYFSATLGYENDIFKGRHFGATFNELSTDSSFGKSYVSTQPFQLYFYNYNTNYSNIQFYVNWSIINSAHEDNSEYGSDKKVTSYSVAFEPIPWDLSEYNYYYIFDSDGEDLPSLSEWQQMTASDKGIGVLSNLKEDGYIYLKVTDKNNNVIYQEVFSSGNQIGKTMIFPNDDIQNKSFINGLVNELDYGGPISSIVLLPVNIVQGLLTAMSSTCSTYHNGTLLGKHIDFPCVTLQSIVGSNLTHIIDVIGAFSMAIGFIAMVVEIYRKATALEDLGDYHTNTVRGLAYSIYRR